MVHPNRLGHEMMGRGLATLAVSAINGRRMILQGEKATSTQEHKSTWVCEAEPNDSPSISTLFSWGRRPMGSYTCDVPKNHVHEAGMIPEPKIFEKSTMSVQQSKTVNLGKSAISRFDRQRGVLVPPCTSASLRFDLSSFPKQNMLQIWGRTVMATSSSALDTLKLSYLQFNLDGKPVDDCFDTTRWSHSLLQCFSSLTMWGWGNHTPVFYIPLRGGPAKTFSICSEANSSFQSSIEYTVLW